jgi:hypothetical protein
LVRETVTLLLDKGEVDLKPFDVVVQRGTSHAWVKKGKEPALIAAVLIDAKERIDWGRPSNRPRIRCWRGPLIRLSCGEGRRRLLASPARPH